MFDSRVRENGDIEFTGRLDASQVEKASSALQQLTTSSTIDFSGLEYISSAGLGILLSNQKRLNSQGFGLKLINLNKHIRDIFLMTGFDKIFKIE
ncbi:MAG TPA: STAS domain-containing protein [Bacteroidota bacterium]|jgi:anti-sigma B factor antagonist|nr:STAS domain-containing protein [Bacteroidota bacterium]